VPDVVLPCLNEVIALPAVLAGLPTGYLAVVADNGSTDGSGQLAAALGARVVHVPQRGFGAAANGGLLACTADIVCFADADGSLDLAELPLLVEPLLAGTADLVLGRRRPVSRAAWPLHARIGNAVVTRRLSRRIGHRLRDLGPMRAARRADLLSLDLSDRRFGYPLQMVTASAARGWRIQEVDVTYRPRAAGSHSKVTGTLLGTVRTVHDMAAVLSR